MYLGIDTSTTRGSVALARPGELLAEIPLLERSQHARDLMERLHGLFEERKLRASDLRGVGVAVGPGSFTGVRIGMATAKGLAYALRIATAGISTLEALARAAQRTQGWTSGAIGAALEAGRGEIYWAVFKAEGSALSRLSDDRSCQPAAAIEGLTERFLIAGSAARSIALLAERRHLAPLVVLDPPPLVAGAIALWAAATIPEGAGYRPGTLGPNYVRPAGAEAPRRRP